MNPPPSNAPAVTILIPHFQTPELIRLCLRSIRKYTSIPCTVCVLDNGSKDSSLDYLRSLSWIVLVESDGSNDIWKSHYLCLNAAVRKVQTPSFVIMHSDAIVTHPDWLPFLLGRLKGQCAAVGCRHQRIRQEETIFSLFQRLRNLRTRYWKPGVPILRSLCALYRTDAFRQCQCAFFSGHREDITYAANEQLVRHGFTLCALPASTFRRYLCHPSAMTLVSSQPPSESRDRRTALAEGTSYLTPSMFRKSARIYDELLSLPHVRQILEDSSLDAWPDAGKKNLSPFSHLVS